MIQRGLWEQENKARVTFDSFWKWLLLPGLIIQWFLYMFPTGGYGRIVSETRVSRSLLMTYLISAIFYLFAVPVVVIFAFAFMAR
jgi:hypothetical protein